MEWYFTFQWGVVFQMRGFIFKGGCPMGGSINFDWGGGVRKKLLDGGRWGAPHYGKPCIHPWGGSLSSTVISLFGIVKWGKEQPKITDLAVTPQP